MLLNKIYQVKFQSPGDGNFARVFSSRIVLFVILTQKKEERKEKKTQNANDCIIIKHYLLCCKLTMNY